MGTGTFLREGLCGDVYLFHLGDVHGVVVVLGVVAGVAGAVDEACGLDVVGVLASAPAASRDPPRAPG